MEKADTPRRLMDKEIADALSVSPRTLRRYKRHGLTLPPWPRTLRGCLDAVTAWRDRFCPLLSSRLS